MPHPEGDLFVTLIYGRKLDLVEFVIIQSDSEKKKKNSTNPVVGYKINSVFFWLSNCTFFAQSLFLRDIKNKNKKLSLSFMQISSTQLLRSE